MCDGNQYAQLVDNGSASSNNSCHGEQAPTVGQKNGSPICGKIENGLLSNRRKFLGWKKIDVRVEGNLEDDIFLAHLSCTVPQCRKMAAFG